MTLPPTESGEGDPGQLTRIAEEFFRLHEAGQLTDLDEFCARYPEPQREGVREECEQLLRIRGVIKQHGRLTPGQMLGSYEILEPIGKGGMGEVYRARDSELDRDIAIKVLPPELACQPERVKRFKREAKAIAALDHPNIVTIYSVEEIDGLHFITMQLVQGKTLAELIPKKGLPLEKFFNLAIPLTEAIRGAHENGITHRDLKPANIMVTGDGRVEILDFGLAKLTQPATAEQSTKMQLTPLTDEGQIVGTVAYMSPEQAEGRDVDHRTDIFSLGIVLYEMVTGERPFKGETRLALMSSIMKDTPVPLTEVNNSLPRHLGRIVRHCLAKDVERRYQTASDVRNELTELKSEIDSGELAAPVRQTSNRRGLWPAVSGALVVVLLLGLVLPELIFGAEAESSVLDVTRLTDLPGLQRWPALSPDGQFLVYTGNGEGGRDIFFQRVDGGEPRNLTGDYPGGDLHPAFNPRGDRVAFAADREGWGIFIMGATGEDPRLVIDGSGSPPAWSPDGRRLVYATAPAREPYIRGQGAAQLWVIDLESRVTELLFDERDAVEPSWSPNDKRIAFWGHEGGQRDIWTIPASGGAALPVTQDIHTDWGPVWSADGRFLYFLSDRGGKPDLWRVPIDEESGETLGPPESVWAPPLGKVNQASISGNGARIACALEVVSSQISRVPFDPDTGRLAGEWQPIHSTTNDELRYMSLSPDDLRLSFATVQGIEDIFLLRADGSRPPTYLTNDLSKDRFPTWYPLRGRDGGVWLTFQSNRNGVDYQIYAIRPNGTGLRPLTEGTGHFSPRWEPNGTRLHTSSGLIDVPEGLPEDFEPARAGRGGRPADGSVSWSRDGQLIARAPLLTGVLVVSSFRDRTFRPQTVRDANGEPYRVAYQQGNRWLDDHRLIFWDMNAGNAFLWDTGSETASQIEGIDEPGEFEYSVNGEEFVFSEDGRTLYRLRTTVNSDIWLLEMSH